MCMEIFPWMSASIKDGLKHLEWMMMIQDLKMTSRILLRYNVNFGEREVGCEA